MITLARIGRIIWIIQIIKSAMNMTSDMAYTELFRLCGARVTPNSTITPEGSVKTKPPGVFFIFRYDQTSRNIQSISCISANSKPFERSILHKKARNPFLLCLQGSIIESVVCKIGKGKYQLWNRSRGF